MIAILAQLACQIRQFDATLRQVAIARYPVTERLRAIPGVGPLTALAFVLTVDDPARFRRSRDVGPWLGLVPKSKASGSKDPELSISKAGDSYVRRLLTQCAQHILSRSKVDTDIRRFSRRLASGGGSKAKRRAVVGTARKLAVVMHRLWISDTPYQALRNQQVA